MLSDKKKIYVNEKRVFLRIPAKIAKPDRNVDDAYFGCNKNKQLSDAV